MSRATVPATLGGVQLDCVIKREASYSAEVPDYPVESGAYTGDTILRKPLELSVTAFLSDTPVTWASLFGGRGHAQAVKEELLTLYYAGELLEFTTPNDVYENMAITSLSFPEDEYLNAMEVEISLKQVTITSAETILAEEYEESGDTDEDAGTTETEEDGEQSLLGSIWSWFTGLFS